MKHLLILMLSLISFSGPIIAQEQSFQQVIRGQIEAFSSDDMEAAFEFASPSIKSIFKNYKRFGVMVRQGYPMVFRQKEFTFKEAQSDSSNASQEVLIEDLAGDLHLLRYTLILLDGEWKITGVEFLNAGITAT